MKCLVTISCSFPAVSCYTELYISSRIWRWWKMDSNILQRSLTITFYLKTQKVCHNWEWKLGHLGYFTHRIRFPLTVPEIRWQNLTTNRTGFYKTVFWIQSPSFWESERHSQFQLSCKMVLNSDWAVMIFFQKHFGRLMFKEHFFQWWMNDSITSSCRSTLRVTDASHLHENPF